MGKKSDDELDLDSVSAQRGGFADAVEKMDNKPVRGSVDATELDESVLDSTDAAERSDAECGLEVGSQATVAIGCNPGSIWRYGALALWPMACCDKRDATSADEKIDDELEPVSVDVVEKTGDKSELSLVDVGDRIDDGLQP